MQEKKRIVIIDDEIDLGQLLKGYFHRNNFEVHVFHSLKEGLSSLKNIHPDICLIDNNFPEGSGWNAVPGLVDDFPKMEIALISAFNATPPSLPGNRHFHVIEKPIRFSDLDKFLATIKL